MVGNLQYRGPQRKLSYWRRERTGRCMEIEALFLAAVQLSLAFGKHLIGLKFNIERRARIWLLEALKGLGDAWE